MKEYFVNYEQALALKELGFDERCFGFYDGVDKSLTDTSCRNSTAVWLYKNSCSAPLKQQAFRWFRENGKVAEVFSQILPSNKYKWGYKIQGVEGITDGFLTYEEAEDACINRIIQI